MSLMQKYGFVGNKAMGESQNGCFKKTKHAKFSEKRAFLTPWYKNIKMNNKNTRTTSATSFYCLYS